VTSSNRFFLNRFTGCLLNNCSPILVQVWQHTFLSPRMDTSFVFQDTLRSPENHLLL
jgi:hypothetical protein